MVNLRILSLGAGVQSSTVALMIEKGEIPMVDCAIFSDTQDEKIRKIPTLRDNAFLHKDRKPIKDVNFTKEDSQLDLFNSECEGMCGV